jgi:diaminopimelate decarboxylase
MTRRLALFPQTAEIMAGSKGSELAIGGLSLSALAREYGTPLYLYSQATLDAAVKEYRGALAGQYPGAAGLTYAGKAFLCLAMAQWVKSQGLWLDCTGVGELHIAAAAGLPRDQTLVHGVNKSEADLVSAVAKAGTIVVDNLSELSRLVTLARETGASLPALWLRFRPGLTVETHAYVQTGQDDSKFGMDAAEIEAAARLCWQNGWIVEGLHFHLGSHFRDPAPVASAIDKTLDLATALGLSGNWTLSPGGGLAVAYNEDELPQPSIQDFIKLIAAEVTAGCRRRNLPLPRLQLEPGRSLVARAGVALYRLGTVKRTAGRRWLLLDGGLADNPRPALYSARYSALPVHEPGRDPVSEAWLAGPYCESGDVLIEKLPLPELEPGELLAIPASGAYQLSMASNYNGARRPAVLWLVGGAAHLIQERQSVEDLIAGDRPLP